MHPLCSMAAEGRITPAPMSMPLDRRVKRSGIYCIWMPADPKHRVYVGQASNVAVRWNAHRCKLRNDKHHTRMLQRAYNKYGEAAWVWALVEECDDTDKATITAAEQAWMDIVGRDRRFNTALAAGSVLGMKHSPAAVEKMRAARTGKKLSPEHVEKIRTAILGQTDLPERIEKLRAANRGRKHAPESIEKTRAAKLGKKRPPETIEKMRAASLGKKWTPEAIAKRTATRRANLAAKQGEPA